MVNGSFADCSKLKWTRRTEIEEECNAVENQNVRNVSDVGLAHEHHLFFGCTHEQETRCIKQLKEKSQLRMLKKVEEAKLTKGGRYWKLFGS